VNSVFIKLFYIAVLVYTCFYHELVLCNYEILVSWFINNSDFNSLRLKSSGLTIAIRIKYRRARPILSPDGCENLA